MTDRRVRFVLILAPLAMTMAVLATSGWDPSTFAAFGEEATENTEYVEGLLGRDVLLREQLGHDGRFFFVQAVDPWIEHPSGYEAAIDLPVYRSQRMLYPVIAGGFGLFSPSWVLWGLVAVNTVALTVGSLTMASMLRRRRQSEWWSLAFALAPGMVAEWALDGGGVLAMMFLLVGVNLLETRRSNWAVAALVASVLAREVMLLAVGGIVLHALVKERALLWRLAGAAAAAAGLWRLFISSRLGTDPIVPHFGEGLIGGLWIAMGRWVDSPANLVVGVTVLLAGVFIVWRVVRGSDEIMSWAAVPFVLLLPTLSDAILTNYFDLTRAVAPIVPAAAFELARTKAARSPSSPTPPVTPAEATTRGPNDGS